MDAGPLILVPAIAGAAVFGFVLWLYASHAFLTVLEKTGSGADAIDWPPDALFDHVPKAAYLGWLVAFWLGPSVLLGAILTALTGGFVPGFLAPLVIWWVAFPLGVLSALSGPSVWIPLWPPMFPRLVQRADVLLGFYALSAPVLLGFGIGFQLAFRTPCVGIPFGVPLMAVAWVLYARLIGRLAFVLSFTRPWLERRKVKKDRDDDPRPARTPRRRPAQPSSQTPLTAPDGEVSGYDLHDDDAPPRGRAAPAAEPEFVSEPQRMPWQEEDDLTPYAALPPEKASERAAPNPVTPGAVEAEMRLRDESKRPKKPKWVWTPGLFHFLIQPRTLLTLAMVMMWCAVVAAMVGLAAAFAPPKDRDDGRAQSMRSDRHAAS